ncbi:hypothetical protein GJ629_02095 [Halapricum sp. CBA1109]|nr:hypothetical protein [Halapricum sp. CBA1109]
MRRCIGEMGNVVVFEPHSENAEMIRKTIEQNGFDNVELVEAAVDETSGTTTFRAVGETSLSSTHDAMDIYSVSSLSSSRYTSYSQKTNSSIYSVASQTTENCSTSTQNGPWLTLLRFDTSRSTLFGGMTNRFCRMSVDVTEIS